MKKRTILVIVVCAFMAFGLIIWQVWHLNQNQKLKFDLDKKEMSAMLLKSAIDYRKAEVKDTSLARDSTNGFKVLDSILNNNLGVYDIDFHWALFDGLGKPLDTTIDNNHNEYSSDLILKTCISCLVMIEVLEDEESDSKEKGFVLDQTPAQMREMRGMDLSDLDYIYLYIEPQEFRTTPFLIPSVLLLGLLSALLWLVHLTQKQSRLITQKNEFVNHLSHQFQTPLSSIKLSANLLSKETSVDKTELIQIIQTESNRLENHIKTVLHWVKSDADHLHITKEKIRLTDLIENALKQMKPVFLTHKTKVNFIPSDEELIIEVDANHLQLMLFNIWENSIKHNDAPLDLTIRMSKENGIVQISNSDNGKGITDLNSDMKFKGLGLAYVNRIMNEHNGEMILKSSDKGLILNLNFPYHG